MFAAFVFGAIFDFKPKLFAALEKKKCMTGHLGHFGFSI